MLGTLLPLKEHFTLIHCEGLVGGRKEQGRGGGGGGGEGGKGERGRGKKGGRRGEDSHWLTSN